MFILSTLPIMLYMRWENDHVLNLFICTVLSEFVFTLQKWTNGEKINALFLLNTVQYKHPTP